MLGIAFSGGKDSLACWYLYRDSKPIVIWVNTGKAYPETLAIVNEIRAQATEFIEVNADQQLQTDHFGLPSDLVPIDWMMFGMSQTGEKPVKVQSYMVCCYENIAKPLMDAAKALGITRLVRGQRLDESHKSTAKDGDTVDGITFIHPIETWSKERVLDFIISERGSIPEHFSIEHSSLDCYDCTAYVAQSHDRIKWTKERHPLLYEKYAYKMKLLKSAIAPSVAELEKCDA